MIRHDRLYRRKGLRPFKCVSLLETFDLQGATNACKLIMSTGFRDFLTKCWLVLHACCVPPLPWEIDHASLGDKALSIHILFTMYIQYVYGNFSLRFCYLCSVYHTSRWSQQPIKWDIFLSVSIKMPWYNYFSHSFLHNRSLRTPERNACKKD